MKGDFTRLGFDPAKRFSRVLMQQGRVQLDRDWNDRQEIDRYLERTALTDSLAAAGAPSLAAGFAVSLAPRGDDLQISPGRLYVGGITCELAAGVTLATQPDLPLATTQLPGLAWPTASGRYLVYLDVWERDVSAREDPSIGEPALGGPDTTTRTRVVAQLRLLQVAPHAFSEDLSPLTLPFPLAVSQRGALAASTVAAANVAGPCVLPPQASYTSLTNQLYRVEIHTPGWLGPQGGPAPTFKWSRDNGSVVTSLTAAPQAANLFVTDLGPDDPRGFAAGQVVELIDDRASLTSQAGQLLLIASTSATSQQGPAIQIDTASTPIPAVDLTRPVPVLLRRWDQAGTSGTPQQAVTASLSAPIALEAGVQIQFQPGYYATGDYWTIPARTAIDGQTGNVIWPQSGGAAAHVPAQAALHQYLPLALVEFVASSGPAPNGQFALVEDCRALFAPATGRLGVLRARCYGPATLSDLQDGQTLRLDGFAEGLMLAVGTPLDASSVSAASLQLHAELPVTIGQLIPGSTDQTVAGTQPVLLATTLKLASPNRVLISPTPGAISLLNAALGRRLAATSQSDFTKAFITHDFGVAANWQTAADGTVAQTQNLCGTVVNAGIVKVAPSIAVSTLASAAPVSHAGASFTAGGTTGDAGLVFNYTSPADFWVAYQSCLSELFGETEGGDVLMLTVEHYQNGTSVSSFSSGQEFPQSTANGLTPWRTDIDVSTTSSAGLSFQCVVTYPNGGTLTFTIAQPAGTTTANYPQNLLPSGFGIMARQKGDLSFTRLQWTAITDVSDEALPIGALLPVLVRLTARRTALRSQAEVNALAAGAMPVPPAPEPDFTTSMIVTPVPVGYYGYAAIPSGQPGIGSELL